MLNLCNIEFWVFKDIICVWIVLGDVKLYVFLVLLGCIFFVSFF